MVDSCCSKREWGFVDAEHGFLLHRLRDLTAMVGGDGVAYKGLSWRLFELLQLSAAHVDKSQEEKKTNLEPPIPIW